MSNKRMKRRVILFTVSFLFLFSFRAYSQKQAKQAQPTPKVKSDTIWVANLDSLNFKNSIDSVLKEIKRSNTEKNKYSKEIFFLLLGTGLGIISTLLSTLVIEWVKNKKEQKELRNAIFSELKEIKAIMVGNASILAIKFGFYDRNMLAWLRDKISEVEILEDKSKTLESINTLIKSNDEHIELTKTFAQLLSEGGGVQIKQAKLPFLEANIAKLSVLSLSLQGKLLDIKTHVSFFNESVTDSRDYWRMTFDTLGEENNQKVKINLQNSYRAVCNRAKIVVDKIDSLKTS